MRLLCGCEPERIFFMVFNPNPDDDIWINCHWGPKQGVFKLIWPEKKKVLVEFHGNPELVDADMCFIEARDCYAAAAAKKQTEAMEAMKAASQYSAKAMGIELEKSA
jgi:hypothetical protein